MKFEISHKGFELHYDDESRDNCVMILHPSCGYLTPENRSCCWTCDEPIMEYHRKAIDEIKRLAIELLTKR